MELFNQNITGIKSTGTSLLDSFKFKINRKETVMCRILCPLCEQRLCEITSDSMKREMRVMVEMKCPRCKKVVKVEFPASSIVKTK